MLAEISRRFLLALPILAVTSPSFLSLAESTDEAPVLVPIKIDNFLAQNGLRRRAPSDVRNLDLQKRSDLIYGSPGDEDEQLLVHMIVHAPDGMHTISMDTFETLTSKVDCQGDDGMLSMSFVSKEAYEHALHQWAWINETDEDRFILVTDHDGCGPDQQRQAYIISQIEHDEASFTTYLTAEPKDLVDAFDKYDIDFGFMDYTRAKANRKHHLQKRESRDPNLDAFTAMSLHEPDLDTETQDNVGVVPKDADIEDDKVAESDDVGGSKKKNSGKINTSDLYDVGDDESDVEEAPARSRKATREIIVDIAVGDGRVSEELVNVNHLGLGLSATLKIECLGCHYRGTLELAGHLEVDGRKPKKFILEASPRNLQARTVVRAAFRVPFDSPHFPGHVFTKPQWPLFEYPVPNAGFIIPGVIGMGLIASYWLGFETTIAGGANFSWGYQVSMPDTAKFSINVLDWPERSAVGFDGTSFEPVFDVHSFQGTVRFSGSSSLKLNFGIKLAKIGDYEVGMRVLAPDGGIVLTRIDDDRGACDSEPETSNLGLVVDSYVGVAVDCTLKIGHESFMYPFARLWEKWLPFFTGCFPLREDSKGEVMPIGRPSIGDGSGPPSNFSGSTPTRLSDSPDPKNRYNDGVGFEYGEGVDKSDEIGDDIVDGLDTIMEDNFNMPDFVDEDGSAQ